MGGGGGRGHIFAAVPGTGAVSPRLAWSPWHGCSPPPGIQSHVAGLPREPEEGLAEGR